MLKLMWRGWRVAAAVVVLITTAPLVLSHSWNAVSIWWAWSSSVEVEETEEEIVESRDPAELMNARLHAIAASDYQRAIESALADSDLDLAQSVLSLAEDRNVDLPNEVKDRVLLAQPDGMAGDIWDGIKGEADSAAGFAAEVTADLFVIGDIRDLAKQAWEIPEQDNLVVAFAAAGILASGATVVTGGAAAPAKFGISVLKIAKRLGKLNAKLLSSMASLTAKSVDTNALRGVADHARRFDWNGMVEAAGKVVDKKVVDELVSRGSELNKLARARGPKATLESLSIAESTDEIATLGKLSEASGRAYRGVLRMSDGLILKPFKRIHKIKKLAKRGDMAFRFLIGLIAWIASGAMWAMLFLWTMARTALTVTRFVSRQLDASGAQ